MPNISMSHAFPSVFNGDVDANGFDLTNSFEAIGMALMRNPLLQVNTGITWSSTLVASGGIQNLAGRARAYTGATLDSSAIMHTSPGSFAYVANSGNLFAIDWDKKTWFIFDFIRMNSDALSSYWVQLKEATTIGNLAAKGIGITGSNLGMSLETYGTSRNTQDTGLTLTSNLGYRVGILHTPATSVKIYVNNVLKATESTAAKIPSGVAGGDEVVALSIQSGNPGANVETQMSNILIWQEATS